MKSTAFKNSSRPRDPRWPVEHKIFDPVILPQIIDLYELFRFSARHYLREILNARVADVLEVLKKLGRQHILIEDTDPATGQPRVRGLFSATHIGRQLGVPVLGFDQPRTFAEIEAALAS
ncbi:MAG: hypothetical protein QM674_10355 [Burkholderiaceae bacterium]